MLDCTSAGTCFVTATKAADSNYNATSSAQTTVTLAKANQTVSFTSAAPSSATVGGTTYTPTATATSSLTVAITVDASSSSVCSITAGIVSFQTVGTCTLDANQAGNGNYNAATQVQQGFSVTVAVSNGATLTDTATDAGSGVASVTYYYCPGYSGGCTSNNWTAIGTSTSGPLWSVTWNGQPSDGAYQVVAVGTDKVTNKSSPSASIPVTVDNSGLSVTMSFPTAGGAYNAAGWSSGAPIAGTASDTQTGVKSVQVSVQKGTGSNACWTGSGTSFTDLCPNYLPISGTTANWTEAFSTSNFNGDGTYTATVEAISNSGSTATIGNSFSYDTTAPTGSVSYANGYVTTASVAVSFSATDSGSGVNTATGKLMRASTTLSAGTCGTFGSYSQVGSTGITSYTDTSVTSGNCYEYEYIVSDNAGNQATITSANIAKVDTVAPSVSLTFPANGGNYNSSTWTAGAPIAGTATDATSGISGASSISLTITQPSTGNTWNGTAFTSGTHTVNPTNYLSGTGSWTYTFPRSDFPASGTYTVAVTATDVAGNTSAASTNSFTYSTGFTPIVDVTASTTSSVSSISVPSTGTFTATAGDVLVFILADGGGDYTKHGSNCGSSTGQGVSDTLGNTWAAQTQRSSTGGTDNADAVEEIWTTTVAMTGTDQVTANWGTCSWPVQLASVTEWSGLASSTADVHSGGNSTTGTTVTQSPAITPSQIGDLVIAIAYANSGTSDAVPSGFTALLGQTNQAYAVYEVDPNTNPITATWTEPSGGWATGIAAFAP